MFLMWDAGFVYMSSFVIFRAIALQIPELWNLIPKLWNLVPKLWNQTKPLQIQNAGFVYMINLVIFIDVFKTLPPRAPHLMTLLQHVASKYLWQNVRFVVKRIRKEADIVLRLLAPNWKAVLR